MEARLTEEEALDEIMSIIFDEKYKRHWVAREAQKFGRRGIGSGGRGISFGVFWTPVREMLFGEHGFDHVIFETNTSDIQKLEKLRKWILNLKYDHGVKINTRKDGRNIICWPSVRECSFSNPLKVTYIFKEEWGL